MSSLLQLPKRIVDLGTRNLRPLPHVPAHQLCPQLIAVHRALGQHAEDDKVRRGKIPGLSSHLKKALDICR